MQIYKHNKKEQYLFINDYTANDFEYIVLDKLFWKTVWQEKVIY